jgi:hypothetical protein
MCGGEDGADRRGLLRAVARLGVLQLGEVAAFLEDITGPVDVSGEDGADREGREILLAEAASPHPVEADTNMPAGVGALIRASR